MFLRQIRRNPYFDQAGRRKALAAAEIRNFWIAPVAREGCDSRHCTWLECRAIVHIQGQTDENMGSGSIRRALCDKIAAQRRSAFVQTYQNSQRTWSKSETRWTSPPAQKTQSPRPETWVNVARHGVASKRKAEGQWIGVLAVRSRSQVSP